MQTTPGSGFMPNGRLGSTRALIAMWVLVVVSCCAALVAFAFVYVNVKLAGEIALANPTCSSGGPPPHIIDKLHTTWLACGVAGVFSWFCAFVANRIASASTLGARRTARAVLVLSVLALVSLACSFGWYFVSSYTGCFG